MCQDHIINKRSIPALIDNIRPSIEDMLFVHYYYALFLEGIIRMMIVLPILDRYQASIDHRWCDLVRAVPYRPNKTNSESVLFDSKRYPQSTVNNQKHQGLGYTILTSKHCIRIYQATIDSYRTRKDNMPLSDSYWHMSRQSRPCRTIDHHRPRSCPPNNRHIPIDPVMIHTVQQDKECTTMIH
jgi:hypothetical protein